MFGNDIADPLYAKRRVIARHLPVEPPSGQIAGDSPGATLGNGLVDPLGFTPGVIAAPGLADPSGAKPVVVAGRPLVDPLGPGAPSQIVDLFSRSLSGPGFRLRYFA